MIWAHGTCAKFPSEIETLIPYIPYICFYTVSGQSLVWPITIPQIPYADQLFICNSLVGTIMALTRYMQPQQDYQKLKVISITRVMFQQFQRRHPYTSISELVVSSHTGTQTIIGPRDMSNRMIKFNRMIKLKWEKSHQESYCLLWLYHAAKAFVWLPIKPAPL